MTNLHYRQEKIQEKRKTTSREKFVIEICSRRTLNFHKRHELISKYPLSERMANIVSHSDFENQKSYIPHESTIGGVFEIIADIMKHNPIPTTILFSGCENTTYADQVLSSRNIYLSNVVIADCQDVLYSYVVRNNSESVIESVSVNNFCSIIYHSRHIANSSYIFYCSAMHNCSGCRFSSNLVGCHDCLFCDHLTDQSYMIRNQSYSKEDYLQEKKKILNDKAMFATRYEDVLSQGMININCDEINGGEGLIGCTDCDHSYFSQGVSTGNNIVFGSFIDTSTNIYDACAVGSGIGNHYYGVMGTAFSEHVYCSVHVPLSSFVFYSYFLENCSYCFGCVGLRNKSYYIYNQEYSPEEWQKGVDEIFGQMEKEGSLGEFFPGWMCPFYFNDTVAYILHPTISKEDIVAAGYLWRDESIKVDAPEGAVTIKTSDLGQCESTDGEGNRKLDETVCKRVIIDENGDAYRIIPMELEFLQKHGLPLPRKHWLTRMKENFRIG